MPREELADPKTKKVLIVDDDESVLTLLEVLIRRDGFRIELATNGTEALAGLRAGADAVVLDLSLPGEANGVQIIEALRKKPETAPPVIVVTAFAGKPEIMKTVEGPPVVAFLRKPFTQTKLLSALHKALKTRDPHSEERDR